MFESLANPKQRAFLAAYAQLGMISRAARIAQCDRTSHYVWYDSDRDYRAAFERAHKMASDALEDEAIRRAQLGVTEPVVHKGEIVRIEAGTKDGQTIYKTLRRRKYSDSLLWGILQRRKPEYGSKVEHEHKHEVSGSLTIDWSALTDEELKLLDDLAQRVRPGNAGARGPSFDRSSFGPPSDPDRERTPQTE